MSWVTHAKSELSTAELQHAVAVRCGETELNVKFIPSIEILVSICAGLIIVSKQTNFVRLVHYTTQEYFERTQNTWFPAAQMDITKACVTYLSFNVFENGFCQTDAEFEERLRSNQLYRYAATNWGCHAYEASTLCQEVLTFLECDTKVEASSQALLTSDRGYRRSKQDFPLPRGYGVSSQDFPFNRRYSGYSQNFPRQIQGLHLAAYFGLETTANALIKRTQFLDSRDSYGRTPLFWAVVERHRGRLSSCCLKVALTERRKTIVAKHHWHRAAGNNRASMVKLFLDIGSDLESRDEEYDSLQLLLAAAHGHETAVRRMLAKGLGPEVRRQ